MRVVLPTTTPPMPLLCFGVTITLLVVPSLYMEERMILVMAVTRVQKQMETLDHVLLAVLLVLMRSQSNQRNKLLKLLQANGLLQFHSLLHTAPRLE